MQFYYLYIKQEKSILFVEKRKSDDRKRERKKIGKSRHVLTVIFFFFRKLFAGLKSLEKLWMYENRLKTIDMQAFISTQNLRIANFGNNELTLQPTLQSPSSSILSPFHHCSKLEYLILWYNNVSNIFEDWQTFSKLKILNLSHNHLQVLRVSVGSRSSSASIPCIRQFHN